MSHDPSSRPADTQAQARIIADHILQQWRPGIIAGGLAALFLMCLSFGYRVGTDLAHKHNHQDCVAEGRSDCQRDPVR